MKYFKIKIKLRFEIALILLLVLSLGSYAQTVQYKYLQSGQPYVRYFSPKEYKSETANWCILQDKRGVMYFGNSSGILEYDGSTWRKIKTPNDANVRSMAMDSSGTIYVCATSDFGYLVPDSVGELKYKSLLPFLDEKYHKFGEIWDVAASSNSVYFKTKDKIFAWNGKKINIIDSVISYRFYNINDTIYTRNNGIGLMFIDGDKVKLMPGGEYFASTGVFNMLPFDDRKSNQKGEILVTTNIKGMYIFDGNHFSKFNSDADSFFRHNQIYNACITANGNFAIATQRGGAAIMDTKGHLLRIIDENSGLSTNVIFYVYSDRSGGLWLATVNGIAHIEYPSPFTIFKDDGMLKDMSSSVYRNKGILYVTNELGVLYLPDKNSTFKLLEGSIKPAYALLDFDGIFLAGTNWGLSIIENNKLSEPIIDPSVNVLVKSKLFPGIVYVGHRNGFSIIQKLGDKKIIVKYSKAMENEAFSLVEDEDGSLWVAGFYKGLYHFSGNMKKLLEGNDEELVTKFYNNDELPTNKFGIFEVQNKMLLASNKGTYKFDNNSKKFIPDSTLGKLFTNPGNLIVKIKKTKNNNLWILAEINGDMELGKAFLQSDGMYKWTANPEFKRLDLYSVRNLYSDSNPETNNEILWISTDDALVRYDSLSTKNISVKYPALIRKVAVNNDSLIYDGASITNQDNKNAVLPFKQNDIRFEFAAPAFDNSKETQFQYFLEGNDAGWSQWTKDTKKEYTNLSSGEYRFNIRAKNIYGNVSESGLYKFKVLPPWYLAWWAFVIYGLIFLIAVIIVNKIMRHRLITKERNRAKLREAELIKKQSEELKRVDKFVRVINSADNLETLFNSLLHQTVNLIPGAEKAAVFMLDHNDNKFRVAYTLGHKVDDTKSIEFLPDELHKRYTQNSDEIEKGIYIISDTDKMYADDKMSKFSKAKSMLVMAVEWGGKLEAYVVFDSFAEKNAFGSATARILAKFREHAVSAISKAQSIKELQEKNEEIIRTQEQLVTQQKLASLGALTAGIAHEIKNPLNFVNNFAEISKEMLDELTQDIESEKKNIAPGKYSEIKELINNLKLNFMQINKHGDRADSIIKGMLLHSRGKSEEKLKTNLNSLLDQYLMLAYHGMRAQDKEFNVGIEKNYDESIGEISLIPQDMSRVFLNLINNACYAVDEKYKNNGKDFKPQLIVTTKNLRDKVEIRIKDNGNGIPGEISEKLFDPFFTTKPSGKGTGLGLSLSYDIIVKGHNGEINYESKKGEFTEFIITLPKN